MDVKQAMVACLEIEGLLILIESREYNVPAEICNLLSNKADELSKLLSNIQVHSIERNENVLTQNDDDLGVEIASSAEYEESEDALDNKVEVSPDTQKTTSCEESAEDKSPFNAHKAESVLNDVLQPSDFSLNDMYRFRKELFNGSDQDFADTLSTLRIMSTAEEINDYLFNDLCWDKENPTVADFLAIVAAHK